MTPATEIKSLWVEPERDDHELDRPALVCHDVFKIFRSGGVETVALRGLDLRIERGELVAVIGASGSGKSTFLSLAAGLDEPSAGEVRALGRSLSRLSEAEKGAYRATDVAIVFQSGNLWPALSAHENVAASIRLSRRDAASADVDEALGLFGLRERAHERAGLLSGGEQQRVAIAAAAARRAALVLADEPTGELDEQNERTVLEALAQLRARLGSTVVVVTHSPRVAEAADRVIQISDGRAAS